ncbi:MAG: hypothetical protein HZB18_07700 [Chloroflexi bacterium]|nr:hypothetical protein [Chloroflexota bacterium]
MQEDWWERPVCFLCDYWWAFLILLVLGLTAWFTRDYWMPAPPPTPVATSTFIPTSPALEPTFVPSETPEPTATRVENLGTGDVQVTLIWDSINDLDLWVTDPAGETIYFDHKNSVSMGELDVDANPGCGSTTTNPVENIYWPTGEAPDGIYTIAVQYFEVCQSEARTPFTITLKVNGRAQTFDGIATEKDELIEITTFEMKR